MIAEVPAWNEGGSPSSLGVAVPGAGLPHEVEVALVLLVDPGEEEVHHRDVRLGVDGVALVVGVVELAAVERRPDRQGGGRSSVRDGRRSRR